MILHDITREKTSEPKPRCSAGKLINIEEHGVENACQLGALREQLRMRIVSSRKHFASYFLFSTGIYIVTFKYVTLPAVHAHPFPWRS